MFTHFLVAKDQLHVNNAHQVRQPLSCTRSLAGARPTAETEPSLDTAPPHSWYDERGTIVQASLAFFGVDLTCGGYMMLFVHY